MLPFETSSQLHDGPECSANEVPGFPGLELDDKDNLRDHLQMDPCSTHLDSLSSKLWMLSDRRSDNISALHRQKVKGRTIIIAEDPKLHLVWAEDRITYLSNRFLHISFPGIFGTRRLVHKRFPSTNLKNVFDDGLWDIYVPTLI